tara:strand:+ start:595 stop:756 length:162 start_codon:yes stop_codon:yes gene_type:complete
MKEIVLWYARGLPGQYWEVKIDCEAAVRKAFPDEGAQKNYARVWSRRFYVEEQ